MTEATHDSCTRAEVTDLTTADDQAQHRQVFLLTWPCGLVTRLDTPFLHPGMWFSEQWKLMHDIGMRENSEQ